MKPGELIPLCPQVSLLVSAQKGHFPFAHSVVIQGRGQTAIIDTGAGLDILRPWAAKADLVLNSHIHPDHTSGNWLFEGTPVWVPRQAWATAGVRDLMAPRLVELPELMPIWKEYVKREMGFGDRRPDGAFEHGQLIEVGGARLEALHTPGHTMDHYCFWLPDEGVLLSGDLDLTPFGPWYGHGESDLAELRASLALCRELRPRLVASSHFKPLSRDIDGAFRRFEAVLDERAERIAGMLARPQTLDELVDAAPIYGSFPYQPQLLRYWEGRMIGLHLEELAAQGRIRREGLVFFAA